MRRLLAALVLMTCALGLAGSARGDEAEDKAVRLVEALQGKVERDDKRAGQPVVRVELGGRGTAVADAELKGLAALKGLTHLTLSSTELTDAGLKALAALENLERLQLGSTKVTGAGLKDLAAPKSLTALALSGPRVTDAG
jgi:internalin A